VPQSHAQKIEGRKEMLDELLEKIEEYAPYLLAGATAGLLLKKMVDELKESGVEIDLDKVTERVPRKGNRSYS